MAVQKSSMMKITETSYLSSDKVELYRTIMRLLYKETEMYNNRLSANEILDKLVQFEPFENLSLDELKQALTQLTNWGNLLPMQDTRKVTTIEEYKNKLYRYSLTEYSIKIERMTIELENLFSQGNRLSSSLLVRLENYFQEIDDVIFNDNLKDVNEWWKNLLDDFTRLDQNFSDYIHSFYSNSGDKMLRSIDFIQHKDKFVDYLRDFIRILQKHSSIIEKLLTSISDETKEQLLEKIFLSELELPRTNSEAFDEQYMKEKIKGQWYSINSWFVSTDSKTSTCNMAMEYTNEIIRKILNNAVMLMRLQNSGISRKQDYKQFMQMFSQCADINEAHCLSAHVFGAMTVNHYKYNTVKETDRINENAIDLTPQIFEVQPKARVYKPRIKSVGFENRQFEKTARLLAHVEKIKQDKKIVESYIKENKIVISNLENEVVPEVLRISLLKWISDSNHNKNQTGTTDFGRRFHVIKTGEDTVLHCNDGDLYMPSYVIEFEVHDNG